MSAEGGGRRGTGPFARGVALLVAIGCFGAIAWTARERPAEPVRPNATAAAPAPAATLARPQPAAAAEAGQDACRARKEAEIAAIRAQGELTAERRMRIRQIEARACE